MPPPFPPTTEDDDIHTVTTTTTTKTTKRTKTDASTGMVTVTSKNATIYTHTHSLPRVNLPPNHSHAGVQNPHHHHQPSPQRAYHTIHIILKWMEFILKWMQFILVILWLLAFLYFLFRYLYHDLQLSPSPTQTLGHIVVSLSEFIVLMLRDIYDILAKLAFALVLLLKGLGSGLGWSLGLWSSGNNSRVRNDLAELFDPECA